MNNLNLKDKCPICKNEKNIERKTCSRICGDELKRINSREDRNCLECNQIFSVRKKTTNKLCSDECRKKWALRPENKKQRLENSSKAVLEKYGVKSSLMLDEVKEKIKKTKIEKYGDENYVNYDKAKKTNLLKYGFEHTLSVDKIRDKAKVTKKAKYDDENFNNRDKAKTTTFEKFGVDFAIQNEDILNKQKETNLKRYGVENPIQNQEIKNKKDQTNLKKYGFENATKNDKIKEKIKLSYYDKFPESILINKIKNNDLELLSKYEGLRGEEGYKVYKFKCNKCNTEFDGTFSNNRPPVCRVCYPVYKNNKLHQEFRNFLIELGFENKFSENNNRIITPFELDFYIESKSLAIELNGNYYHSEIGGTKDRNYHLNKTKDCYSKNIKLIHIFEDEWIFNKNIIKSKIKNSLGLIDKKIFARKCEIKIVNLEEKRLFLNNNHIQGDTVDEIRLGLYYNEELISLITFIKLRNWMGDYKKKDNSWELSRFCSKIDYNIVGGFSKLLNFFIKNYNPNFILTFADCRWSGLDIEKTVYIKNNFNFIKFTPPSYWYFKKGDYLKRYHRFTFNKKKILKLIENKEDITLFMTEWELAQTLKMDRIWDCGNIRFEMDIK